MTRLIAILLLLFTFSACSVLDGGDRQALRDAIDAQPLSTKDHMRAAIAMAPMLKWLRGRPKTDAIFRLLCGEAGNDANWVDVDETAVVEEMIECLDYGSKSLSPLSYLECGALLIQIHTKHVVGELSSMDPAHSYDCKGEWFTEYNPKMIPGGTRDLNKIGLDDMVDWLILQPAPPPGFALPELVPLLPYLCPLDVGWGCPEDPHYPGLGGDKR